MRHTSILLLAFSLIASLAFSQQSLSTLTLRGGMATIQGETSSEKITATNGPELSLLYSYHFKNRRFALTAEVNHSRVDADLSFASSSPSFKLNTQIEQTYFGLGIRHVLNPAINDLELSSGQLFPYLGLGFGAINSNNDIDLNVDTIGGYTVNEQTTLDFTISAEFGLLFMISSHWALDIYLGARTAKIDTWDALSGSGDGNDWIIHGGLGVQYLF